MIQASPRGRDGGAVTDEGQVHELELLTHRVESGNRQQLARELHDSVAQALTLMVVDIELLKRDAAGQDMVVSRLENLQDGARGALHSLRQVLYELREQPTTDTRFVPRVRTLLERLDAATGIRSRLQVSAGWPSRLSAATAHQLYRIMEEALNNVRLHSSAGHVNVALEGGGDVVSLTVQDDGRGLPEAGSTALEGMGLMGMRERVALLGGQLTISSRPGMTTVRAELPTPT